MTRTNIDLDDVLVERIMRRHGLDTKREAVHYALRRAAGEPMTRDEALGLEGSGWEGDLDALREVERPGR